LDSKVTAAFVTLPSAISVTTPLTVDSPFGTGCTTIAENKNNVVPAKVEISLMA
jgi:hypothetical protein